MRCLPIQTNPPLISIIIPAYNAQAYLRSSIKSVCDQTYRPLEVIVVDDGSVESCELICAEFPQVQYIYQDHSGPAVAMNTGLANCHGTYVAFHNADDLYLPGKLTAQYQALNADSTLGFVLTHIENFVEPGIEPPTWFRQEGKLKERMGFVSTALVRREVFEKVGDFNPAYLIGEDMDWLLRARDAGVKRLLLAETFTRRRIHDANLSADVALGHANLLEIIHASVKRNRAMNPP